MSGQVPVPPLRPARRRAGPGPCGGALAGPPQTPPAPWYRCLPSASATRLPAGTAKAVWCLCCFCTLPFHFVLFVRQTGTDTVTAATASRRGSLSSLTEARRGPGRPGSPSPSPSGAASAAALPRAGRAGLVDVVPLLSQHGDPWRRVPSPTSRRRPGSSVRRAGWRSQEEAPGLRRGERLSFLPAARRSFSQEAG